IGKRRTKPLEYGHGLLGSAGTRPRTEHVGLCKGAHHRDAANLLRNRQQTVRIGEENDGSASDLSSEHPALLMTRCAAGDTAPIGITEEAQPFLENKHPPDRLINEGNSY